MADVISYLPEILREIYEFRQIAAAQNSELDSAEKALSDIVADNFVETLTERGCERWEKMLKINRKATDDIEVRRFRILAKLNEQLPFTFRGLKNQLEILCGKDGYSAALDNENYSLTVWVALTAKNQFDEVGALLGRVVPANIVCAVKLKYNQHQTLAPFTHGDLAAFTHDAIRNEVI